MLNTFCQQKIMHEAGTIQAGLSCKAANPISMQKGIVQQIHNIKQAKSLYVQDSNETQVSS